MEPVFLPDQNVGPEADRSSPLELEQSNPPGSGPQYSAISCRACRTRKVKCSRERPCCAGCQRNAQNCEYPESRQVHTGKRKNMHGLDVRLSQLEEKINGIQEKDVPSNQLLFTSDWPAPSPLVTDTINIWDSALSHPPLDPSMTSTMAQLTAPPTETASLSDPEHLCPLKKDLIELYFQHVHYCAPMLHPSRYLASVDLPLPMQPPTCLQYIVMAHGSLASDAFSCMALSFYRRARAKAEADEREGDVSKFVTLAHTQCWILLSNFEAQQQVFGLASVSLARAVRLAHMLGLHSLDDPKRSLYPSLPAAQDWCETEARRRTWWVIFSTDRFLVGVTSLPTLIQDRDIHVLLPASEEAFDSATEEPTGTLDALLQQKSMCSSLAGRVLAAHIFYRISDHLALSDQARQSRHTADREKDASISPDADKVTADAANVKNGAYWCRHRQLDNDLLISLLTVSSSLRLSGSGRSLNSQFVSMSLQTSVICLHRAARTVADALHLEETVRRHSTLRMLSAAQEILVLLRVAVTTGDIAMLLRNPLLMFSIYMVARILLDDFSEEQSRQSADDLEFLLRLLESVGRQNNVVATSLATQLGTEMRQCGIQGTQDSSPKDATPLLEKRSAESTQFVFGTTPKASAGSTSNCYSIPTPADSMDVTFDCLETPLAP